MLRRTLILAPRLLALLGALGQLGCADESIGVSDSPGARDGGMADELADMSLAGDMLSPPSADVDAGPSMDPEPGFPANAETGGLDSDFSEAPAGDRGTCYDEEDNDRSAEGVDCEDSGCAPLRSCCVDSARADCCAVDAELSRPVVTFGAGGCASLDCVGSGSRAFGSPGPEIGEGLSPGGDLDGEGGVVFEPAIDVRNRSVTMAATFAPPTSGCTEGCLETAALALLDEAPPASGEVITAPLVALRYTGATDQVQLEVEGELLQRFELEPAARWGLEVTPSGAIVVRHAGSEVLAIAGRVEPGPVLPAVVGRTRNPSATGGEAVALGTLEIVASTCDIPSGWSEREPLDFTEPPTEPSNPSLLLGDPDLLAVDVAGVTRLYRRTASLRLDPVALTGTELDGVHDAELVREPDGATAIYALAFDGALRRGVVEGLPAAPVVRWDEAPLLPACDCDRSSPTIGFAFDGARLIATLEGGRPWVRVTTATDPSTPLLASAATDAIRAVTAAGSDEKLQHLALSVEGGAWRLHATYTRGTRSLVRLFVSDELLAWRPLGTIFTPDGDGFDGIAVLGFASAGQDESGMRRAVYVGSDGVRRVLGGAIRPTP